MLFFCSCISRNESESFLHVVPRVISKASFRGEIRRAKPFCAYVNGRIYKDLSRGTQAITSSAHFYVAHFVLSGTSSLHSMATQEIFQFRNLPNFSFTGRQVFFYWASSKIPRRTVLKLIKNRFLKIINFEIS